MSEIGVALVKALVATIVVEEILAFFWRERSVKLAFVIFFMNVFTNPAVNVFAYIAPDYFYQDDLHYYFLVAFLELLVLLFEWRILARTGVVAVERRAFLMALTLNACSYLAAWPLKWAGYW